MCAKLAIAAVALSALGAAAIDPLQAVPAAGRSDSPDGRYEIDPTHTIVMFKITHLGISNFYGRFNKLSGKLLVDAESPAESMISFSIDAASIDTNHADRDKHLRSPDFFNAAEHPRITFESESVAAKGGKQLEVTGTLSLHGVERKITVLVEQTGSGTVGQFGTRVGYEARFTIQRSDFKMDYMPELLGNDVEILISLEATRSR